jgi:putative sterol carrier protein
MLMMLKRTWVALVFAAAAAGAHPAFADEPGAVRTVASDGRVRSALEYFQTLHMRFRPEAARGLFAIFQFDLWGDEACAYTVMIRDGQMTLTRGLASQAHVVIRMNATDYVKVINGEMSGSGAYLRGAMKIRGSLSLARKLSRIFPPGALRPSTNPPVASLD